MAKTITNPVESMRLDIEFADNGIILRNPDCDDEITLALFKEIPKERGYSIDNTDEYLAIGKKISQWLTEVAVDKHADYWISTGAKLRIQAELTGRPL